MVQMVTQKIDKNGPRITKHQANLNNQGSMDLKFYVKFIKTTEYNKKTACPLKKLIKLKTLEKQIKQSSNIDLRDFEKWVFEERKFSEIQKYLNSIRKNTLIPPIVKLNDEETSVDKDEAECFNRYFISVFIKCEKVITTNTNESLNKLTCD